jgi:serum/glucocorticoid-regulated kinase 2
VRGTRAWKRFVRVRTDDLESTRIERTIKRVRSDIAVHTGTSGGALTSDTPARTPAGSTADREAGSSSLARQRITEEDGLLGVTTLIADDASADENARRLIDSGMVDFTPPPVLPTPAASPRAKQEQPNEAQHEEHKQPESQPEAEAVTAEEQTEAPADAEPAPEPVPEKEEGEAEKVEPVEAPKHEDQSIEDDRKTVEEHPSRIPRSVSADPDKASRLSRTWQESPVPTAQSETEGEATEAEATEATDAEDTDAFAGAMSDVGGVEATKPRKKKKKQKAERKPKKVVIDDFEMMRVLGKGCAGKVLLVRHKRSDSLYALKAITKRHVLAHQELQHTMTEQAVLKRMARSNSDPFVVKLYWSFHDKENLFLVMVRRILVAATRDSSN